MNPKTKRDEERREEEQPPAHSGASPAHSLEDAANSRDTLQGYAAINEVDEHSEISQEAARETGDDREEIAQLAYQYHQERGGHHGSHEEDWYRAERTVRERRSKAASSRGNK